MDVKRSLVFPIFRNSSLLKRRYTRNTMLYIFLSSLYPRGQGVYSRWQQLYPPMPIYPCNGKQRGNNFQETRIPRQNDTRDGIKKTKRRKRQRVPSAKVSFSFLQRFRSCSVLEFECVLETTVKNIWCKIRVYLRGALHRLADRCRREDGNKSRVRLQRDARGSRDTTKFSFASKRRRNYEPAGKTAWRPITRA